MATNPITVVFPQQMIHPTAAATGLLFPQPISVDFPQFPQDYRHPVPHADIYLSRYAFNI